MVQIISLFLISFSYFSYAGSISKDECGYVRLDEEGGSMEYVPRTQQGSIGICYAHAAVALVDAYRFSHSSNEEKIDYSFLTSTTASAVLFAETEGYSTIESGEVCKTVKALQKYGICRRIDASIFPKSLVDFISGGDLYVPNLVDELTDGSCDKDPRRARAVCTPAVRRSVNQFCSASPEHVIQLPELNCTTKTYTKEADSVAISDLQNHFNGKSKIQPVSINFCSQILEDVSYNGQLPSFNHNQETKFSEKCIKKQHSSVLIGRRWDEESGQCQFLLRNTWGEDCDFYGRLDPETDEWVSSWSCENGQLWIDADVLAKNLLLIDSIE